MEGSIEKLDRKMKELLSESITREKVAELTESYKTVLEKTMWMQPDVDRLRMPPDELLSYVDGMYDGILDNYEAVRAALEYPAPMFVAAPERLANGDVKFAWEASYSYQGRPVKYHIRLYEDYHMQSLVYEQTDIEQTEWIMDKELENGVYYLQVTVTDNQGHEQFSLEHVENDEVFQEGLLEFVLTSD